MIAPGDLRGRTLACTAYDAPSPEASRYRADLLIEIDSDGRIARTVEPGDPAYTNCHRSAETMGVLVALPGVLLPGFVDLHIHAPQYAQLGTALDVPLEDWLQQHTFPLEARFADLEFAASVYSCLVEDLLANGTTTAVYFGTIHSAATRLLADICIDRRQRALVGKVVMDAPDECPDFYRDTSLETAIAGTREVIRHIRAHPANDGFVYPVVTPRFTPSCTDAALTAMGHIAQEEDCHIQTHCSESDWQHGHALARFGHSDTEALDAFGLIGRRTILAHGNFLSDNDMDLIAAKGAAVAHCPYSNAFFSDAVFPLRTALDKGVHVGLGTDISGGPSASLFDVMRMATVAARLLESGVDPALPRGERGRPGTRIDSAIAFYLATAGGADALDLPVGSFTPGHHFDAMLIDPDAEAGTIRLWPGASQEAVLETILITASRPNITAVWTGGRATGRSTGASCLRAA